MTTEESSEDVADDVPTIDETIETDNPSEQGIYVWDHGTETVAASGFLSREHAKRWAGEHGDEYEPVDSRPLTREADDIEVVNPWSPRTHEAIEEIEELLEQMSGVEPGSVEAKSRRLSEGIEITFETPRFRDQDRAGATADVASKIAQSASLDLEEIRDPIESEDHPRVFCEIIVSPSEPDADLEDVDAEEVIADLEDSMEDEVVFEGTVVNTHDPLVLDDGEEQVTIKGVHPDDLEIGEEARIEREVPAHEQNPMAIECPECGGAMTPDRNKVRFGCGNCGNQIGVAEYSEGLDSEEESR